MSFQLVDNKRYVCWAARADTEVVEGLRTLRITGTRPFRFMGLGYQLENGAFNQGPGMVGANPVLCVLPTIGTARAAFRTALSNAIVEDMFNGGDGGT